MCLPFKSNKMKIYYLINVELGWDNVVTMALSPQKCVEDYTDGEVIPETEAEAKAYCDKMGTLVISSKYLYED